MSEKDTVSKKYFSDNERFADLFNFYLYGGKQVIKPEQLRPLDSTAITLPYGEDKKVSALQRQRDLIVSVKADESHTYLLLAAELQSELHYAMVPRIMLYDSIQYADQIIAISKAHKGHEDKPSDNGEFLSGFFKTDKLLPVITLTVFLGADEWDAPRTLHEMLQVEYRELLKFIPDYKLNLISPAELNDEDFGKFHTELSPVLKYLKYSLNKEKLSNVVNSDPVFRRLSFDSAVMLNTMTNSNITIKEDEESIDMCKAIQDLIADGKAEGKAEEKDILIESMRKNGITEEQIKLILETEERMSKAE